MCWNQFTPFVEQKIRSSDQVESFDKTRITMRIEPGAALDIIFMENIRHTNLEIETNFYRPRVLRKRDIARSRRQKGG